MWLRYLSLVSRVSVFKRVHGPTRRSNMYSGYRCLALEYNNAQRKLCFTLTNRRASTMAVTESSLLTSFLIPPAPLAVSLSLDQFTELFPKARRDDPVIPALYRELQKQRSQDVDRVKQNIAAEAKLGSRQQQHIRKMRLARLQQQDKSDEAEMSREAKVGDIKR